jgi:hypothetical protein
VHVVAAHTKIVLFSAQIDGVDCTFTRANEISTKPSTKVSNEDGEAEIANLKKLPLKKTDFSIIGKQAQLQVAIALTSQEPDIDDFDNYPLPSAKQIAAKKQRLEDEAKKAEEEARQLEEQKQKEAAALQEAAKPKKKSATKVEQISSLTSEVVRVSFVWFYLMNNTNTSLNSYI